MNLQELREEAWSIARENTGADKTRLWTRAEMNRYINRTYRTIARETRCIVDSVTPSVCQITVAPYTWSTLTPADGMDYVWANDPNSWLYRQDVTPIHFALNPLIIEVEEAKWTNKQWRLTKVSVTKWQMNPWWEQVKGMPTEFATDYSNNRIAINFRATDTDILRLKVRRLPLTDLIEETDVPEFRTHYHDYFINGILWQMYSKQDAETIDLKKADAYKNDFYRDMDEIKQSETLLNNRLNLNHSLSAFR